MLTVSSLSTYLPSFFFRFLKGQRYIYFVNSEMHSVLNTYKNMYVSGVEMNNSIRDRVVWCFLFVVESLYGLCASFPAFYLQKN